MRGRTLVGIVLMAVMVLGSMAAFAEDKPYPNPRAEKGPIIGKKLVLRRDVARPGNPVLPPGVVLKPVDPGSGMTAFGGPAGSNVAGRGAAAGATLVATASPQVTLENRLKSLAKELR